MAEVLLTDICNLSCPYCFAVDKIRQGVRGSSSKRKEISLEDMHTVLSYLNRKGGGRNIRFVGGEPTLHSKFKELTSLVLDAGVSIQLYTNGLFDSSTTEFLLKGDRDNVFYTYNINHPDTYASGDWRTLARNLAALRGKRAIISYNIYEAEFDYAPLVDIAEEFSLNHFVLALASPTASGRNIVVSPHDYKRTSARIVAFSRLCSKHNLTWSWNCCVPLCMFTPKQLGEILVNTQCVVQHKCSPTVSIGPDLTVWRCLGTSNAHTVRLADFASLSDIDHYLTRRMAPFSRVGLYDRCLRCGYMERNQCQGGCLGGILAAFGFTNREGRHEKGKARREETFLCKATCGAN